MQCSYIKPDGTQCNGNALKDQSLCLFHSEQQKRFNQNVRETLINSQTNKPIIIQKRPRFDIKNIDDIPNVLISLINQIHGGTMDPKKGGVIGYLTNILLRTFEVKDMDKRLARVESILNDVYVCGDMDALMNEIHPNPAKELKKEDYTDYTKRESESNINQVVEGVR